MKNNNLVSGTNLPYNKKEYTQNKENSSPLYHRLSQTPLAFSKSIQLQNTITTYKKDLCALRNNDLNSNQGFTEYQYLKKKY